jgi:hypothetical protein
MRFISAMPVIFVAILQLLGGCSTTTNLTRPLSPAAFQQLEKSADGQRVDITFYEREPSETKMVTRSGLLSLADGRNLQLTAPGMQTQLIPLQAIHQISVKKHAGSAIVGMLLGLSVGLLVPVVFDAFYDHHSESGYDPGMAVLLVPGVLIGTLGGLLIGAAVGSRTIFTF